MKMLLLFLLFMNVSQHALAVVVEVNEGERSVLLLCLYSGFMPKDPTVMWTRNDLQPKSVHLRGGGGDDLRGQNQHYSGRTSMNLYALITKDFSLTLRKPTITDSGNYTCSISAGGQERRLRDIQLQVKDQQMEVKVKEGSEFVILPCKTNPDLPEDTRVEWTRSDLGLMMIHEYSNKSGQLVTQDDFYKDRTHMNEDVLRTGDLSLTLKQPKERDTGRYICTIYRDKDILRQKVVLNVKEPFPSWAIALLVLLVLLVVSGGLLFYFRHCFMSVYKVEVDSGVESVQLPCKTSVHLHKVTKVEWKDRNNRKVYVHHSSSDQPEEQDTFYRHRMKMKRNLLKTGNLSLNLKYPTERDTNTYTCTVYSREGTILMTKNVLLHVRVPQVVKVNSGVDFVKLTCKNTVHLPEDAKVEWTCIYNRPIKVHVYQNSSDHHKEQDQIYRDRTEMNKDPLRTGDLSLTLKYPTDWDKNIYTCTVYSREEHVLMKKQVELNVRVCQVEVEEGVESVQLPFKTTENLPEDIKVVWWDSSDRKVHVYPIRSNWSVEQDWFYKKRTEMNKDLLKTGDLSLTLKHPTGRDSREYRCKVYGKINRYKKVLLKIKVPQLVEVDSEVEFVQLPCITTVHVPEDAKVEWTNRDNKKVHVYQNGSNQPEEQNQCYRDRTKIGEDLMKTGDLSLTLQYPTDWDSNTYTCTVYSRERCILVEKKVKLKVRVCQVEVDPGVECIQLPFRTTENLPEDVVAIWSGSLCGTVHVYHNSSDEPEEQDQDYRDRTKMDEDLLRTGDLSLTLKHPTERDDGMYRCDVLKNGCIIRRKTVQLKVKETFQVQNETWEIGFRSGSTKSSTGFNFTCHSSNHGSSPDVSYGSSFVEPTPLMGYNEEMNYHGYLFQNDTQYFHEHLKCALTERGGGERRESTSESSEEESFTLLNQWKTPTK